MKDYAFPFKVESGTTGRSFDITPESGEIVGCVIYLNNNETQNQQMVTAGIKEASGNDLAKMQPIEAFRTRDVESQKDGKPLVTQGGNLLTLNIASRATFDDDLYGYIVFVYNNDPFCN